MEYCSIQIRTPTWMSYLIIIVALAYAFSVEIITSDQQRPHSHNIITSKHVNLMAAIIQRNDRVRSNHLCIFIKTGATMLHTSARVCANVPIHSNRTRVIITWNTHKYGINVVFLCSYSLDSDPWTNKQSFTLWSGAVAALLFIFGYIPHSDVYRSARWRWRDDTTSFCVCMWNVKHANKHADWQDERSRIHDGREGTGVSMQALSLYIGWMPNCSLNTKHAEDPISRRAEREPTEKKAKCNEWTTRKITNPMELEYSEESTYNYDH